MQSGAFFPFLFSFAQSDYTGEVSLPRSYIYSPETQTNISDLFFFF